MTAKFCPCSVCERERLRAMNVRPCLCYGYRRFTHSERDHLTFEMEGVKPERDPMADLAGRRRR